MLPAGFSDEGHLDDVMTAPSRPLIEMMGRLEGDIMVLGIGGKMGHTLGRQAVRAIEESNVKKRVVGVSRFSDSAQRKKIEDAGVETIACDLLDSEQVSSLPDIPNIVFMAGRKFGTRGGEHLTWAMNTAVPASIAQRFKTSQIVVFSTGCVYPLVEVTAGGCSEDDPVGPVGEYSMSCLGRERIFEHYSATGGTPVALARLNYAIDMRYGVLHDIASSIFRDGIADISVPAFNAIWQGDATDRILRTLEHCASPPFIINITGLDQVSTRETAIEFGKRFGREVAFTGTDGTHALLSDSSKAKGLFGAAMVPMDAMIDWTAAWIASGGISIGKPTHFQVTDGKY